MLALLAPFAFPEPASAATLRLSWSSDSEADPCSYRLRYGTASGAVDAQVDAGAATSVSVAGLDPGVTYFFSVVAYDASGNESAPSTEVQARLATNLSAPPMVETAKELSSQSIYAVRSIAQYLLIHGRNFASGATVDLGPGVTTFPPTRTPAGDLVVRMNIPASTPTGPRSVTVLNPDLGVGTSSDLFSVVKTPDANSDCTIDVVDLNTLARAWNERSGEARYAPAVDLDGDDYVGPEDLTIFVTYFGLEFTGCP